MKNILVVDDHTMFRQALLAVLLNSALSGTIVCDDVKSALEAHEKLAANHYDLVVLDIAMPVTSGMALLPEIKTSYPETSVLMLSMYPEEQFALQSLRLGASGYLTKQEAADELLLAMETILKGGKYVSRSLSSLIIEQVVSQAVVGEPLHARLSNREMEIFRRLVDGQRLKNIADDLSLSIKTISTYKTRLNTKMGFKNDAELISYGLKHKPF
ncbi:MAG: response regulator transcription factor [Geobacter sp.]|nr:response regulator transcription factor [Geobacter sp.]